VWFRGRDMRLMMILGMTLALAASGASAERAEAPSCVPAGEVRKVPELVEASGIAMSQRVPGRLWALNDSGAPVLYALDSTGAVAGQVELAGARVDDWEAVAVGRCGSKSCIYVGDIGDNDATRTHITIYRAEEPADASGAVRADAFHATYPDGPQDAEALIVDREGTLFIVTKGETGPVAMYKFPGTMEPGTSARLERVGAPRKAGAVSRHERITDASLSADGEWVALRTTTALSLHRAADLVSGNWNPAARVGLESIREPQGEGVTFAGRDALYLVSEGGGKARPGWFARLECRPAR
jgi:hypothetical protein